MTKQISLITSYIDKLNLRLIRTFNYIQRFNLLIKHKSKRLHLMFDALFCLFTMQNNDNCNDENEFDVLFTIFMTKINKNFKKNFILKYQPNSI